MDKQSHNVLQMKLRLICKINIGLQSLVYLPKYLRYLSGTFEENNVLQIVYYRIKVSLIYFEVNVFLKCPTGLIT